MKTVVIIIAFLAQLLLSLGYAQHTDDMLKIPLKEPMSSGTDYPAVQFGSLMLKPDYFQIYPESYYNSQSELDSVTKVQMMFNATVGDVKHPVYLQHYENEDGGLNIYPVALREYLIGMEVINGTNGLEAVLILEKSNFGKEFFLDEGQEAIIDGLTVRVDRSGHKHAAFGPDEPFTAIGVCDVTLSDENGQKSFGFTSHEMEKEGWPPTEWGKYKVWILEMYDRRLKLRIEEKHIQ